MRSGTSKAPKAVSKSKQTASEGLLSSLVNRLQVPKLKAKANKLAKADIQHANDQSRSDDTVVHAEDESHLTDSPASATPYAADNTEDVAPNTPEPLMVLPPIVPNTASRRSRRTAVKPTGRTTSKEALASEEPPAKSAKKKHLAPSEEVPLDKATVSPKPAATTDVQGKPVLKNGDDVFRFMQDLAKEAEHILPQEDERPKRKRKAKEEDKGSLLEQLRESWGTETYFAKLEKESQQQTVNYDSPLYGVVVDSVKSSPMPGTATSTPAFSFVGTKQTGREVTPSLEAVAASKQTTAKKSATQTSQPATAPEYTAVDDSVSEIHAAAMAAAMELTRSTAHAAGSPVRSSPKEDKLESRVAKKSVVSDAKVVKTATKISRAGAGFGSSSSRGLSTALEVTKKSLRAAANTSAEVEKPVVNSAPASRTRSAKENVVPQPAADNVRKSRAEKVLPSKTQQTTKTVAVQRRSSNVEQQLREKQDQLDIKEKEVLKLTKELACAKDESRRNKLAAQKAEAECYAIQQRFQETNVQFAKFTTAWSKLQQAVERT